jgi:uncharacterized protein (DUF4415 family)
MKGGLMKKRRSNPVPPEIHAEIDALAGLLEEQIDIEDIPEVEGWDDAKRGVFYRPIKQQITLRLDADLVDWFQYGTVKQKMQDFSTIECGVQSPDRDLLGLNRTVLGLV